MNTMKQNNNEFPKYYAFVDGSYNRKAKRYGHGGFLVNNITGEKYTLQGSGNDSSLLPMQSVAGEITGSIHAIEKAIELGIPELTIFYDNYGIEYWATGKWKRNKDGTKMYHQFIMDTKCIIKLYFVKVKAHSGIPGNEEADLLARQAVGLE